MPLCEVIDEMASTVVWFWNDLRLSDNPAFVHAARRGPVVPVFLYTRDSLARELGGAKKWWLHNALKSLEAELARLGLRLIVRSGESALELLKVLIKEVDADAVYWNKRYELHLLRRDAKVKAELSMVGVEALDFESFLLHDPDRLRTVDGKPFLVFTPFWKKFLQEVDVPKPLPAPSKVEGARGNIASESIDSLGLLPKVKWYAEMEKFWDVSEGGAWRRLRFFIECCVVRYKDDRDRPDLDATSMMSPYLSVGMISPRQVWHEVVGAFGGKLASAPEGVMAYLRELGWREFSYHILHHNPELVNKNLRAEFDDFPWSWDRDEAFERWTKGLTGVPMVDAGMRQLWALGWMHNRVRMIVASWLTKNMLKHWKLGEEWFWDTLVDTDLANNVQGWQWTAGCGADAAPYFRIFNPVSQGLKFDPRGEYVKRWVPELRNLPAEYVHAPWEAPEVVLRSFGVRLGVDYPTPILPVEESRRRALDAFERIKKRADS